MWAEECKYISHTSTQTHASMYKDRCDNSTKGALLCQWVFGKYHILCLLLAIKMRDNQQNLMFIAVPCFLRWRTGGAPEKAYCLEMMVSWHSTFRRDIGQGTFLLNPETYCLGLVQSCQCQDPLFPAQFLPGIQSWNSQHGKPCLPNIDPLLFLVSSERNMAIRWGVGGGGRAGGSHVLCWKNYISQYPLQPELVTSDQRQRQKISVSRRYVFCALISWPRQNCGRVASVPPRRESPALSREERPPLGVEWSWVRATRIFSGEEVGARAGHDYSGRVGGPRTFSFFPWRLSIYPWLNPPPWSIRWCVL